MSHAGTVEGKAGSADVAEDHRGGAGIADEAVQAWRLGPIEQVSQRRARDVGADQVPLVARLEQIDDSDDARSLGGRDATHRTDDRLAGFRMCEQGRVQLTQTDCLT